MSLPPTTLKRQSQLWSRNHISVQIASQRDERGLLAHRYVGELSLLLPPERKSLCFSVLDFWGNRQVRRRCKGNVEPY